MSDPIIRNLLRRFDRASPQWHDEELNREFPERRDRLLSSGLIRPIAPRTFAECPHCGGVPGRVRPILNPKTEAIGLWLSCATCGMVEVRSDSLRRWRLDIPALVASIASAAGVHSQPQPFADERGWYLGRAPLAQRLRDLFLLRAVRNDTVPALRDRLATYPKAILLTASAEGAFAWQPHAAQQRIVPLEQVLSFDEQLRLDQAAFKGFLETDSDLPKADRPPAKTKKAGPLAKIHRLKTELIAHIRSAKKHALDQQDRGRTIAMLPRPSKSELAALAGLKPHDVTRCFDHEAGRELKVLWEVADDLDQILRYGG